jgi:hypothetical protein
MAGFIATPGLFCFRYYLDKLRERRHPNIAAVALDNKNARIVWALLSSG